jgi:Tfp pilus assembly protein PilO
MKSQVQKRNKFLLIMIGLFSLLALSSFVAGWVYANKINKDIVKLNSDAKYLIEQSEERTEASQRYNRVSSYNQVVMDSLPGVKETSTYLASVEELAAKDNINIAQTTIGANSTKSTKITDLSQTIKKGDYYELQIKYMVNGSYSNFQTFLVDLANLRRVNTVDNLSINKDTTDSASDQVQITFTNSIYLKK